ncbi:MAG: transglycosylase SLT domain-containing protein [Hyphomicrobium sp.]|nr:transglycosylase SLT domain-containing protein [Hyphomicrobium sp.]
MTRQTALLPRFWPLIAAALAFAPLPAQAEPVETGESPKPALLKAETEHIAKLDALLAPVRALQPSTDDAKRIREAIEAVKSNTMARFSGIKAEITDPVGQKLVEWARLRAGYGTADEYRNWLKANPLWPERSMMVQRMEEALFTQGGSAQSIKEFFKSSPPETGLGYAALASAYLAEDNKAEAKKYASKAWRDMPVPGLLETGFLRRFSDLLSEDDHKWRFDRMTTDDVRWAGNRADRAAFARRVIPLLSEAEQKKATARLAVFNKSGNARALMDALPTGDGKDWGLAFHRAQLLRKSGKVDEAAKIILAAPKDPEKIAVLDEWWAERRELAYGALKAGNAKLAYELAKDAGALTVNPLKEQTFMAGWIAFRYLKNPDTAEKHFKDLAKAADGPLSRAKAAYWLARIAESRGDKAAASEHYKAAAKNPDTFHGLLAMQKAEPGRNKLVITPPQLPTDEQAAKFNSLDAVKAVVLARKAGLSRDYTRGFLTSLRIGLTSEAEAGMVAHLAEAIGDTQMSLRVSKSAIAKGQNLLTYGYPVHPFPAYKPLRKPPETAFLLGIARQETEFEPQTVSGAGAKGLLQVMNVTAKEICTNYKFKCEIPRLLTDNAYNVKIASAYIANYMDAFSGSYVLGLAGYNAGPGRARQWIRENGDPRDPKVDIIDWIERIPITETREYVTKVLSNIQVYRARLGEGDKALRLEEDLARARGSAKMPAESKDDAAGTAANTEG